MSGYTVCMYVAPIHDAHEVYYRTAKLFAVYPGQPCVEY